MNYHENLDQMLANEFANFKHEVKQKEEDRREKQSKLIGEIQMNLTSLLNCYKKNGDKESLARYLVAVDRAIDDIQETFGR